MFLLFFAFAQNVNERSETRSRLIAAPFIRIRVAALIGSGAGLRVGSAVCTPVTAQNIDKSAEAAARSIVAA